MSKGDWFYLFLVGLMWLIGAPVAFVTMYSALDLQAAAKSAEKSAMSAGGNGNQVSSGDQRLAALKTIALARKLDAAEENGARFETLSAQRSQKLIELFEARDIIRTTSISVLAANNVEGLPGLCIASDDELARCQVDKELKHCTADWNKIQQCSNRAGQLLRRSNTASADQLQRLDDELGTARKLGFEFNRLSARVREASALEKERLLPVAEGFRAIKSYLPFFGMIFILPEGVMVACFTVIVSSISATVASLVGFLRADSDKVLNLSYTSKHFILSPLVGGLAGFMVYFVVVAGTAFVTQTTTDNSLASNNLSVPALASLGVFAGLASERAITWLREKAASFFASGEDAA